MAEWLVTFMTAFGVFVAFQQWRTNEKSRKDRFLDRRFEFYENLKEVISYIYNNHDLGFSDKDMKMKFQKLVSMKEESRFLFDEKIYNELEKVVESARKMITFSKFESFNGDNPTELITHAQEMINDFLHHDDNRVQKLFMHYLKIEKKWEEEAIHIISVIFRPLRRFFRRRA
jgi:hypothetical protein